MEIKHCTKMNDVTTMIDIGLFDLDGAGASYLIRSKKTCVIDAGTRQAAPNLVKSLKELGAFPPDYLIISHAHYDHCQGVPILRKEAAKYGKEIQVFAGEKALPLLQDQSFNEVFDPEEKYENIEGVAPIKEGDVIDLEGIKLEVYEVPGHTDGHVAIYDPLNKDLFLGDCVGIKVDKTLIPPCMPPLWNEIEFLNSMEKLKAINYNGIFLAHFGYLEGERARKHMEGIIKVYQEWWNLYSLMAEEGKLSDTQYVIDKLIEKNYLEFGDLKPRKALNRLILGMINVFRRIGGKGPINIGNIMALDIIGWQLKSYEIVNKTGETSK